MSKKPWSRSMVGFGIGLVAVASVFAAACAPAAEPKAPAPAAEKPAAEKPAEQKPAAQKPAVVSPGEVGAKFGGIFYLTGTRNPISFNPWEESIFTGTDPVTNNLIQMKGWGNRDDPGFMGLTPSLAQSWEWSKDGLSLTVRLVDGAKWHDGQPFTCADAKWSIDTIRTGKGLGRSPRAIQFRAIREIECPDPLTMVIRLNRAQPSVLTVLAGGMNPVWPKHLYEKDPSVIKTTNPVGTGPFRFVQYLPGEKVVYARNPDYWNKPYPYLDGIEYLNVGTPASSYAAIRAGRSHADSSPSYMSGAGVVTLSKECQVCQVWPDHQNANFMGLHVNHQRPPWSTKDMKDALSYAIDRKKVSQLGFDGWLYPGGSVVWPGLTQWSLESEPWLKQVPGYNVEDAAGNREKAKALLQKMGYKPGDLKLTIPTWNTAGVLPSMVSVQEDLKAVGIEATITLLETAKGYEVIGAGDFDVMPWSMGISTFDPDGTFYEHYYTGSDRNYGRYSNPETDRLIDQQSQTMDPVQRKKLISQAAEILMKDHAKFVLGWYLGRSVASKDIKNWAPTNCALCDYGLRFERVWLASTK
ncbi:MAG: hypothetical protein HY688_00320 [Chloroflexi bacterium]|nr:hypothetical protein [Chloroflexota bacterium]